MSSGLRRHDVAFVVTATVVAAIAFAVAVRQDARAFRVAASLAAAWVAFLVASILLVAWRVRRASRSADLALGALGWTGMHVPGALDLWLR